MADEATIIQRVEDRLTANWPNADVAMILPNNPTSATATPSSGKYARVYVQFKETKPWGLPGGKRRFGAVQIQFYWVRNDGSRNVMDEARAIANILDGQTISSTWFTSAAILQGPSDYAKLITIPFIDTEEAA